MHICKSNICIIKKKKNKCQVFLQKKPDLKLNKNTTGKKPAVFNKLQIKMMNCSFTIYRQS